MVPQHSPWMPVCPNLPLLSLKKTAVIGLGWASGDLLLTWFYLQRPYHTPTHSFCKFRGAGGHQSVQGNVCPSGILQHPCLPLFLHLSSYLIRSVCSSAQHTLVFIPECPLHSVTSLLEVLFCIHTCCCLMPARFNLHSQTDYSSMICTRQADVSTRSGFNLLRWSMGMTHFSFLFYVYSFLFLTAVALLCCTLGFL